MTFENPEAIFAKIKALNTVPQWIVEARKTHKDLKALVYGEEYIDLLLQIEHIETHKKAEARKKYARPIKDINRKLLAPVENIFSATGGTKSYDIKSDSQLSEFINTISNARYGKSVEEWLHSYVASELLIVDPSGLIFMEWMDGETYPTYKSIDTIRCYEENGQHIRFVIFEPKDLEDSKKLWRVVDDAKDYSITQDGEVFTVDEENTFANPFGECPGLILSDRKRLGRDGRTSYIDDIIETEKEFLRDRSILTIHKFLNGFSTPYRPGVICPECSGTKKKGIDNCDACNGTGLVLEKDIIDEIILPIDLNSEKPSQLPTNWAGFISPDLEIWDKYRAELNDLFKEMFEALWGTRESDQVKDQTAMGVILNTQPMITQLNKWSSVIETHEKAISDYYAKMKLSTIEKSEVSFITYGRNYIVQPPEFLLSEYQDSNKAGDPIVIRDRKISEYITAKYKNDPELLRSELIKKQLEPYVHFDIKTVFKIYGPEEARKKGWFTDFWESLMESEKLKDKLALEGMMDAFFKVKMDAMAPPAIQQPDNNEDQFTTT
jgi:hypothetical protein